MTIKEGNRSRRSLLTTAASAAGGLALGASLGCTQETQVHVVEINALLPTPEQMQTFLTLPDFPVMMVNLLKFKPDGGVDEYAKYITGVRPILENAGAKILFSGEAVACVIGNGDWDMIALVEYPSPAVFSQMVNSDAYQAIHHHREAGLEGQVLYAVQQKYGAT
jgi:uncharacterized protein (DUF1330 family)